MSRRPSRKLDSRNLGCQEENHLPVMLGKVIGAALATYTFFTRKTKRKGQGTERFEGKQNEGERKQTIKEVDPPPEY